MEKSMFDDVVGKMLISAKIIWYILKIYIMMYIITNFRNSCLFSISLLQPLDTDAIVPKWDWCVCSQEKLARLFSSEFWLSNLYFFLQSAHRQDSSLTRVTSEKVCHVPGLWHLVRIYFKKNQGIYYVEYFVNSASIRQHGLYPNARVTNPTLFATVN